MAEKSHSEDHDPTQHGDGRWLECIVVTPEAKVLQTRAEFIALPLYDGELGVAPRHTPLIARLGYGELRVRTGSQTTRWYVDGGFAQVVGDVVWVLTARAVPAERLDPAVAREQLSAARSRPANSQQLLSIRSRLQDQARGQIRVAERAGR